MPLTKIARSGRVQLTRLTLHHLDWPAATAEAAAEPPIILLHPNRTNARVWDFVVEHSTLPNRWLAPDQRGHGRSDYPESGYQLDDYVTDLVELLDALGVARAHFLAAATGGNIALLVAAQHPERVASLTVVDPGLSLDPAISHAVRDQMKLEFRFPSLAEARARMPFSAHWSEELKEHYARYSFRAVDGPDTGVAPDEGEVEWRYFIPGVIETEAALEHDMWDRIDVRCPLLAIRGAESMVFDETRMARLKAIVPACETLAIAADHRVSQDNPQALAAAVDDFIRRSSSGA